MQKDERAPGGKEGASPGAKDPDVQNVERIGGSFQLVELPGMSSLLREAQTSSPTWL
jgi:hypothetical protein